MEVRDIVKKYLEDNGYDGLYEPGECACKIDDLAPCGSESVWYCTAGYLCDPPGEDFAFGIGARKPDNPPREVK